MKHNYFLKMVMAMFFTFCDSNHWFTRRQLGSPLFLHASDEGFLAEVHEGNLVQHRYAAGRERA